MTLEIEFTWLVGLLITIFGAAAGVGKLLLAQHQKHQDAKFAALERAGQGMQASLHKRLDGIEISQKEESVRVQKLEREFLVFKAELPMTYLQRTDHIRSESVTQARLDAIAGQLTNVQMLIGGQKP
ncbi:hypothetical protein AAHN93_14635 [Vandammella animalimorsus]|uniref:hypothetical protein n=1 Tax=Comamonadaceae TaxID=80864 RepID=UPI0011C41BCF|nr:hypothetical protein [Allofranklinella schreckenbergeri]